MTSILLLAAVLAASHDGRMTPAGVEWRSTFVADAAGRIALAVPLPPGTGVGPEDGAPASAAVWAERDAAGKVVALDASAGAWRDGRLVAVVRTPADPARLLPPFAEGEAVQRVTLAGPDGPVRFVPDASLGIEQYIGYAASPAFSGADLSRAEGALPPMPHGAAPLYLRADRDLLARGLEGSIRDGTRDRFAVVGAAVAFAAVVGVLGLAARKLARRAQEEKSDALLQAELERMRRLGGAA